VEPVPLWHKEPTMPKSHPPYDVEFRRRVVELARSGKAIEALSREFGPTSTSIRNWVRQSDLDEGVRKDGLTSDEKAELTALRRENARLREERDILKKAAAWFAQESTTTPKRRSDS
jgi:transposase-like protein